MLHWNLGSLVSIHVMHATITSVLEKSGPIQNHGRLTFWRVLFKVLNVFEKTEG